MRVLAPTETTPHDRSTTIYAPTGQTLVAHNPASYAIGASEPEGEDNRGLAPVMSPDIELVHFGSDSVHCYREPSDEELAERERQYRQARVNRDPRELPF